ncbi:type II toxin-antitoxin system RelE/ParE family toxin [Desulfotignum balticum]|uniref:type II toxin-antitoxin system RelE/ParE family toxin n=1 Tax=Desulfotignum balticum TaxID=115781 RepID=UPI00041EE6B6|nr:type II toxin-antitoxin system RelE/ParE family toxin [Desulfotignum balticum]
MKKYDVYLMPDAIKDLENIYDYITEESGFPERGWSYIEKLKFKCQKLEIALLRGQTRNDLMIGVRIYPLDKKTVAAFLVDEDNQMVKILNIFYGGQDYEAIMSPFKTE